MQFRTLLFAVVWHLPYAHQIVAEPQGRFATLLRRRLARFSCVCRRRAWWRLRFWSRVWIGRLLTKYQLPISTRIHSWERALQVQLLFRAERFCAANS